jgi:hypothetical protein
MNSALAYDSASDRNRDNGLGNGNGNRDGLTPPFPFPFPSEGNVQLGDQCVREAILEVHKGKCFWTRAPIAAEEYVLDHIWPRSLGGPDSLFNLVPTSASLNGIRGNAFDLEAATAILAIVRMVFGPRSLVLLGQKKADLVKQNNKPPRRPWSDLWWLVDEQLLLSPRKNLLSPDYPGLTNLFEEHRLEIAASLRKSGGDWHLISDWATANTGGAPIQVHCLKNVWRGVVFSIRVAP